MFGDHVLFLKELIDSIYISKLLFDGTTWVYERSGR